MKAYIKIGKTIIKFGDIEIKKQKLHQHKRPILKKYINFNKIVVSDKVSFGKKKHFKYFIGYKDAEIGSLYVFLPKISAYRKDFDENLCLF